VRYGVLADIHGNLRALQMAVQTLDSAGVDRYIVAGDLVGYGPEPNECVELVAGLDAICIAGNHDLIAIGRMSADRCIVLAQHSLSWTSSVLTNRSRMFLGALPLQARTDDGVVVAHGSLDDPEEYTTRPATARDQLARISAEISGARVLILGHTHRPWAFGRSGTLSTRADVGLPEDAIHLNPGSVGQSRELRARARCLLLRLDEGKATFLALRYDMAGCQAALRDLGLPSRSCHLRPSLPAAGARATRLMVRRLSSR
jgi:predicted phosphodiesterase